MISFGLENLEEFEERWLVLFDGGSVGKRRRKRREVFVGTGNI
jgi:hypothetical protein